MRRHTLTAVLVSALGLIVPGTALAHNHGRHHGRSHHHAAKARDLRFTPASVNSNDTSNSSPTNPSQDSIGKVDSFTNGKLTIILNDNSSISGMVDPNRTEIECVAAPTSTSAQTSSTRDDGRDGSGDGGSGDGGSGDGSRSGSDTSSSGSGDQSPSSTQPNTPQSGDDGAQAGQDNDAAEDQNDAGDQGENQGQNANGCDSSLLVHNESVRSAELVVSPDGSTFRKLVLFH